MLHGGFQLLFQKEEARQFMFGSKPSWVMFRQRLNISKTVENQKNGETTGSIKMPKPYFLLERTIFYFTQLFSQLYYWGLMKTTICHGMSQ